jgi:hypothetical protein
LSLSKDRGETVNSLSLLLDVVAQADKSVEQLKTNLDQKEAEVARSAGPEINSHAEVEPTAMYIRHPSVDRKAAEHAVQIDRERRQLEKAEQKWADKSGNVQQKAAELGEMLELVTPAELDSKEPGKERLRLLPLSMVDALASAAKSAVVSDGGKVTIEKDKGVLLATRPVWIDIEKLLDHNLILGGALGNPTAVRDTYLSHDQLEISRRTTKPGANDDLTGAGVALDVTHLGKNNSYLVPVIMDARFSADEHARIAVSNKDDNVVDKRMIALRKGENRRMVC